LFINDFSESVELFQKSLKYRKIYIILKVTTYKWIKVALMKETEYTVCELFRTNPAVDFTTTQIVERITPGYPQIHKDLTGQESDRINQAKRRKAELHRKTLYYLNKLVRKGILTVKSVGRNKERTFSALNDPREHVPAYHIISHLNPPAPLPALGIEGFEEKGIIARYKADTWVERVNSILLESTFFKSLKDFVSTINNTFNAVNDVIALNDFEYVIQNNDPEVVLNALKALNKKAEDYALQLNVIIDLTNVTAHEPLLHVVNGAINEELNNIIFIYDTTTKEFLDHKPLFKELVTIYSRFDKGSLYIKNQTIHRAPYLWGKAGPYTLTEQATEHYKRELKGKIPGLVCGNAAFMIDIDRLFNLTEEHRTGAVIELIVKLARSLLLTNAEQRARSEHFLKPLIQLAPQHAKDFFKFSHNYVRFWNYGWKSQNFDQAFVTKYLSESKKAADDYCINEETIYKSCGMPTRFRIAYSCVNKRNANSMFSKPNYKRIEINSPMDFFSNDKINKAIDTKEEIFRQFDGGDRLTFDRPKPEKPEDAVNEISYILNTYRIPFIRYKFTKK